MTPPLRAITTPAELADFYENMLDDSPDRDLTYQLLSSAKNRIEVENKLQVLMAEDTSKSVAAGQTYLTTFSLPDDWRETVYLRIGKRFFHPTSFAKRSHGAFQRYFIDLRNKLFGFTGTIGTPGTVYHGYLTATDDFMASNEDDLLTDILAWPSEYFPIIAYEALGFYQTGVDTDTINAQQGAVNLARAQNLLDGFIGWDQDQKLSDLDNATGFADDECYDDFNGPTYVGSLPG